MGNISKHKAVIHFGSNKGHRVNKLQKAIHLMEERLGDCIHKSRIYQTAPWGNVKQQDFLNQAIILETYLAPIQLLEQLLGIEEEMGRKRKLHWGPRLIDLDLVLYDDIVFQNDFLTIPHPRMHIRNFVLIPLLDIIPDWKHPVFHQTMRELLAWCPDDLEVKLFRKK